MTSKLFIVFIMFGIVFSLGNALYHLVQHKGKSDQTVKALTWRIGLSIGLFVLLFIGFALGIIHPHGL